MGTVIQVIGSPADICSIDSVGVILAGGTGDSGLDWFVRHRGVVRGPCSSARIRQLVLAGELDVDDEVSRDRVAWRWLGGVPEVIPLQMRPEGVGLYDESDAERRADRLTAMRTIAVVVLLLAALTSGVLWVGTNRVTDLRDCASAPAPGVLLEGCQLAGMRWRGASLSGARMAGVVLSGARLAESDLTDADLRYADLTGADLAYARLAGANLKGAGLRLADLTNADLSLADLSFADLSGARLGGARLQGALFGGAIWTDGRGCGAEDCPR